MKGNRHAVIAAIGFACLVAGCADVKPHRTMITHELCEAASPACANSIRERTTDYDLLFVEFDDQGLQYPSELAGAQPGPDAPRRMTGCDGEPIDRYRPPAAYQISIVVDCLNAFAREDDGTGLSVVVYVHGWRHDASSDDANVDRFRRLLQAAAAVERARDPRERRYRVVGIYVGWRGRSSTVPGVEALTFWTRKFAASHVALGSSRELFSRLLGFKCDANAAPGRGELRRPNVRMILLGHSFGGIIVYNAVSGPLTDRLTRTSDAGRGSCEPDLVVLVNPAFEATRYTPVHRIASSRPEGGGYQAPIFVAVTSEADVATRRAFPFARSINSLFQRYASDEESIANRNTMGHVPAYLTHRLSMVDSPKECEGWKDLLESSQASQAEQAQANRKAELRHGRRIETAPLEEGGSRYIDFCGGVRLTLSEGTKTNAPVWNVRATRELISSHSDLGNARLWAFLRQLYHDTLTRPSLR